MSDPYKVLGVSPTATDDEVKAAYRELAKKYHPDNYANSPLEDLATEKMKEVNEAYDQVMAERRKRPQGIRELIRQGATRTAAIKTAPLADTPITAVPPSAMCAA